MAGSRFRHELLYSYIQITATIPYTPVSTVLAGVLGQVLCSCFPSDCHICSLKEGVPGSVLQSPGSHHESSLEKMEKFCFPVRRLSHSERAAKRIQRTGILLEPCCVLSVQPQLAQISCDCQLMSAQIAGQGLVESM